MKLHATLFLALLVAIAGCHAAPPDTSAQDKAGIATLENNFVAAVKAKDVNAIMSNYVTDPGMVVFDVIEPLQYTGPDAYHKDWQAFLAEYPGPVNLTLSDLDISTGGDVAYSHSIQHLVAQDKTGKQTDITVRVTDGYKKVNGQWLIAHEHVSIPVDLVTMQGDPKAH